MEKDTQNTYLRSAATTGLEKKAVGNTLDLTSNFVTRAVAGMYLLNEQTIGVILGNFSEVGFPNLVVFGLYHVNPSLFNVYISLPLKIEY